MVVKKRDNEWFIGDGCFMLDKDGHLLVGDEYVSGFTHVCDYIRYFENRLGKEFRREIVHGS